MISVYIKSSFMHSNILGLHILSPLTQLPHPEQLPGLRLHSQQVSYTGVPFWSFIAYFYCPFSMIDMFGYTNTGTYYCVIIAYIVPFNTVLCYTGM